MKTADSSEFNNAKDTLRRFVIRAKRVEAHSLVKNNDVLNYVEPKLQIKYSEGKSAEIKYLMPDEEIFESLAARVRPCILKSESVYLDKVFHAIEVCMNGQQMEVRDQKCFTTCRYRFNDLVSKRSGMSYSVQLFDADNKALEAPLTDLQIGEAWLYSDLVHSDPHGDKAKAAELSYRDRYYAGTSFFSTLTVVVINTYRLITLLNEKYEWHIDEDAWQEQVTLSEKDSEIEISNMYVLPVGTIIPEGTSPADMPEAINISSLTEAKWVWEPQSRAVAICYNEDTIIGRFHATYFRNGHQLTILIDDSLLCSIPIEQWPPVADDINSHTVSVSFFPYNNAGSVSEAVLLAMRQSDRLEIILNVEEMSGLMHINIPINQSEAG
ncbi:hypothetical protein [uncultured Bifidobacterium sp.]|uniref:hypothetical protein n=1 Tax=uncultured Bifidobacterium sp. TaxID=165187 RepID=UPI00258B527F|nr:hypothetical protein [uncultured Bifidobacterium sp.]